MQSILTPTAPTLFVIGGEDQARDSDVAPTGKDILLPPHEYDGGETNFTYTYDGVTYTMRYLTITSAEDSAFIKSTSIDLLSTYGEEFLDRFLNTGVSLYVDCLTNPVPVGTIISLLGLDVNGSYYVRNSSLTYHAMTTWTRTYIQVWDDYLKSWMYASSAEYAISASYCNGYIYNSSTNAPEQYIGNEIRRTIYSKDYNNLDQRKEDAAIGFIQYATRYDLTGSVKYNYDGSIIITHKNP